MNLHTDKIKEIASDPSKGTSNMVCSRSRYYRRVRTAAGSSKHILTISDNMTGQKLSRLCGLSRHRRTRTHRYSSA